ncbi:MAG: ankyrin repeat domain-containing protein [Candidatus Cloacimonetes bacterium]|nr:ankyrin repeat domain-containing protein [Candidatus Cloacimonadota bacterium]
MKFSTKALILTGLCVALSFSGLFAKKKDKAKEARDRLQMYEINYDADSFFKFVEKGNYEIVQSFIDAGFDPNTIGKGGTRALIVAAKDDNDKMLKTLLKGKADPNLGDADGSTALMYAAFNRQEGAVKTLMKAKPNVNKQNKAGMTALMFAVLGGNSQCVNTIITEDTDLELKNTMDYTASGLAKLRGYIQIENFIQTKMDYFSHRHTPEEHRYEIEFKKGQKSLRSNQ